MLYKVLIFSGVFLSTILLSSCYSTGTLAVNREENIIVLSTIINPIIIEIPPTPQKPKTKLRRPPSSKRPSSNGSGLRNSNGTNSRGNTINNNHSNGIKRNYRR